MDSITEKIQETIKAEEIKNADDISLKELQELIDEIKRLGLDKKPDYTLPLPDTIGRIYYSSLNKQQE